jgi:ubiquinone/menaquinone biosynthesis C-methylase UbiE
MKAESNVMPRPFEVDQIGDLAHISFFSEPVLLDDPEEGPYYSYDYYKVVMPYRNGIESEIESNYQEWVDYAKSIENLPKPETGKEKIARMEVENNLLLEYVLDVDYRLILQELWMGGM